MLYAAEEEGDNLKHNSTQASHGSHACFENLRPALTLEVGFGSHVLSLCILSFL
jgi:hypothetical protein